MKILKIIHGYPQNYNAGSEVYSQSICEELSKEHEVIVFTREENPYQPDFSIREEEVHANLRLCLVNMAQGKDGYRHAALDEKFKEFVQLHQPDIAHIGHLNHLSTGIVDVLNELKIPIVFTLHDFWLMCPRGQFLQRNFGNENIWQLCDKQENKKCASQCYNAYFGSSQCNNDIENWTQWINERMIETKDIIEKVDLFIAPSKYLMNRFISEFKVPENKIKYLDYGFPTHYLTPTHNRLKRKGFTFGYIGTHIPSKGINLLIEAFRKVDGNARLLIWGSKDQQSTRALQQLANESKFTIEFKGAYVNKNLADEIFSQVDAIVVPSIWAENSPLVIHEAQACKIPVITADFGGMAEYVHHMENGLLFKHRSTEDLKEKLQWAINHSHELKLLGERGYINSENGNVPDISDHCKELLNIYKKHIKKVDKLWRITIDTNPEDCNLNCIMCEEHSPFSKYIDNLHKETGSRKRRMPVEWLDRIFDQVEVLGIKEVIPSTMGEPLIYKAIEKIYDLAKQKGIKINLTTNGTFPRKTVKEWAEIIIPNTSDVKISWNGSTKETSEKVMIGIDFDKVISNVKEFVQYRDKHFLETGEYCRITFQLTFMQNNMHELGEIVKLAADLNIDRLKGHHLWDHFSEIKHLSMKFDEAGIINWNKYVMEAHLVSEKYRRPNKEKVVLENIYPIAEKVKKEIPFDHECPFLNKELWISATGKISPCCAPDKLRDDLGDFGNIQSSSISEALRSSNYQDLVKNYKSKELCKTCNMRKP